MSFCIMPKPKDFVKLRQEDFDSLNSDRFSFIGKILTMAKMLQLTDEEIYQRKIIVAKMIDFLQPYYPDCDIMIFGSSLNGFGFKGCDLDLLFLPFPGYCNLDFHGEENDDIPSPYEVLAGRFPREKLLHLDDKSHLKFVHRVMFTQKKFFKRIIFIPAKCPILNIQFVRNSITCDFSASNRLVMYNTELLWLFGTLDSFVKPLVIILRYWAKSLGLISKSLLSSYAFSLMVIFYLQNIQPPVLPSVRSLIELSGHSRVIDGWETAICLDHNHIPKSMNSDSIDKLLIQFFEFYWNFDFIQNVVSPYHGRPLPVKDLKESENERIQNFQVTPFSIQDAFVLSHNVSRNSNMKTSFKLASFIAKKLTYKKNFKFQSLFDISFYEEEMAKMFEPTKNNFSNFTCCTLHLNYKLCCVLGITSQFDPWYRKVCQVVLDVLQYGLLVECEVVDSVIWSEKIVKRPPKKKRKVRDDNVGNLQLIMSIQCALHSNTLWGRKQMTDADTEDEKDDNELPVPLREPFQISKCLIKKGNANSQILWFMCQCYKYPVTQIPDVIITFSPLSDTLDLLEKKHALNNFVQKYANKILEEDFVVPA